MKKQSSRSSSKLQYPLLMLLPMVIEGSPAALTSRTARRSSAAPAAHAPQRSLPNSGNPSFSSFSSSTASAQHGAAAVPFRPQLAAQHRLPLPAAQRARFLIAKFLTLRAGMRCRAAPELPVGLMPGNVSLMRSSESALLLPCVLRAALGNKPRLEREMLAEMRCPKNRWGRGREPRAALCRGQWMPLCSADALGAAVPAEPAPGVGASQGNATQPLHPVCSNPHCRGMKTHAQQLSLAQTPARGCYHPLVQIKKLQVAF